MRWAAGRITALSIAAFPEGDFPPEWAQAIVRGRRRRRSRRRAARSSAATRCAIRRSSSATPSPGLVRPAAHAHERRRTAGRSARLTKPLGTGIVATALKAGEASRSRGRGRGARRWRRSTRAASEAALRHGVTRRDRRHRLRPRRPRRPTRARERPDARDRRAALPAAARGPRAGTRSFQSGGLKANRREFEPRVAYQGTIRRAPAQPPLRPADLGRAAAARSRGERRPRCSASCRGRASSAGRSRAGLFRSKCSGPPEPASRASQA